jgi:hypothetical protein
MNRSQVAKKAWRTRKANQKKKVSIEPNTIKTMTLCEQLDDSVTNLEARLYEVIRRINSLM